jgi:hypothetical protein
MAEIGTERVEPTVRVPEPLRDEPKRERGSGPRRKPARESDSPDDAPNPEASEHQIDSLA